MLQPFFHGNQLAEMQFGAAVETKGNGTSLTSKGQSAMV
jgi:hypothetical protein